MTAFPFGNSARVNRAANRGTASSAFNTPSLSPVEQLLGGAAKRGGPLTLPQREELARGEGYGIQNGQAVKYISGIPNYRDLGSFSAPAGPGSNLDPALSSALLGDARAMQAAADEQFARLNSQIGGMEEFNQSAPGRLIGQAGATAGQLGAMGNRAEALGRQQEGDFKQYAQGVQAGADRVGVDVSGDINEAYRLGNEAVAGFGDAITKYEDRGAQDASAAASAIRRAGQSMLKEASVGINPDGTPMTTAQKQDMAYRAQQDVQSQVQEQITPILSRTNDTLAGMRQTLAGLKQNNANLRISGGDLRVKAGELGARTGIELGNQMLESQRATRDMIALSADLHKVGGELQNAAQLNAVNLEMQGRLALSQLIQQNPRSVTSWFQGLLAMYSVQAANSPGGGGGGGNKKPSAGGGGTQQTNVRGGRGAPEFGGANNAGYSRASNPNFTGPRR